MARALLSVSDKRGIAEAGKRLAGAGLELVATGGTARALREAGLDVIEVSDLTGFPEILDGRVKTLHPAIHGALLARRDNSEHMSTIADHGIGTIDVLVSNLYPFSSVVADPDVSHADAVENIDIGGPAMLRAAAKNYEGVVVLVDPGDYAEVLSAIESSGLDGVDNTTRRRLSARAFGHVSAYDSLIAEYLRDSDPSFPSELSIAGGLLAEVRYGENPHQKAAIYKRTAVGPETGIATWVVHEGKQLSYNNYLDASAAWTCAMQFEQPAAVMVKHTLPCGVGVGGSLAEAYELALSGDPVSAFGGILAFNSVVTLDAAETVGRQRLDIVIAPGYDTDALEVLARRKNRRIIIAPGDHRQLSWDVRSVPGGLLVQDADQGGIDGADWSTVTDRKPTESEMAALQLAWRVIPWVKSNAIVLAQENRIVGIGAGQPNRLESVHIAARVAGDDARGSVLASDAFFPFADGLLAGVEAGATAVIQPGGSVRDDEVIAAANDAGIAMVFTGKRHFRH
ncbi:MAG: bifunctional phosphoribosylaminoimidazolecarboxamide formyltransferase/IMP cyclohydrolase [Thermomicrobiales bacterium]